MMTFVTNRRTFFRSTIIHRILYKYFIAELWHIVAGTYGREFHFSVEETQGWSAKETDVHIRQRQTPYRNYSSEETQEQRFFGGISFVFEEQASAGKSEFYFFVRNEANANSMR